MKDRKKSYWSGYVTKHSFALDLEPGVFTWNNPKKIAQSFKRSAQVSLRRRARYINQRCQCLIFILTELAKI